MQVGDSRDTWRDYREHGRHMYALACRASDPWIAKAYFQLAAGYLVLARTAEEREKRDESTQTRPGGSKE